MSIDSTPTAAAGGDIAHSTMLSHDLGVGHLAESQLSSHADIAAARSFFQPATPGAAAPAFTTSGAEATAVAGKAAAAASGSEASAITSAVKSVAGLASAAGSEAAAMGAHAIAGIGAAAAGAAEVSPMIQLIMRLPGLGGVAQDFFEWLMALFTAPAHLAEIFDPTMWAHLGTQLQSSLSNLFTRGIGGAEHFQVPLSMLPANAPFLQQLGMQAGHSIGELNRFSSLGAGLGNNSLGSSFSLNSHMNISSPLDLKKPQFEMGQSSNVHTGLQLDGKMSGPMLSNNPGNTSFLSGTQRLFSDQISNQQGSLLSQANSGAANNMVSNASTPMGSGSSMNISSNTFNGPEMSGTPANYSMSDGVLSGTGVSSSTNVGYHLSDAAPAAMDKAQGLAPSGAVSNTLGGKELLASNDVPSYQPSMGGSYFKPATAGGDSASSGMTELKAEPMSLLKHAQPTIGHTPAQGAVDQIGHQTKGALHASNQTSSSTTTTTHSSQPAAHSEARQIAAKPPASEQVHHVAQPKHVMDKVSHTPSHHIAAHAAHPQVERASAQVAKPGSEQTAAGSDQTAMNNAGADRASSYSVQRGDNLWDIAKKQLGDGSRWSEIYKLNSNTIGSNPDLIHSGLDLKMPGADTAQISDASAGAGNYTVQPGDNLWDIAKDKLGDGSRWGEIFHANKAIIGENPRLILPGEQIQLPSSQPILTQAAPPPPTMAMQVNPNAAAAQGMPSQAMAPQYQAPLEAAPQQVSYMSGPGAAGAATLDPTQLPNQGPVSASLAPDLSFLYTNGKH